MSGNGQSKQKLKLGQKLSITQVQLMQLVSLPYGEISERIKAELEENPALEEGHGDDELMDTDDAGYDDAADITEQEMVSGDYASDEDMPDQRLHKYDNRMSDTEIPSADEPTLIEALMEQLQLSDLSAEEIEVARFVVGSLDATGYLRRDNRGLLDDLAIYSSLYPDESELDRVITVIQSLEPAGIGARDLQECLLLQLRRLPTNSTTQIAEQLLTEYFDLFSSRRLDKVARMGHFDPEELREAARVITTLNPSPGLNFQSRMESVLRTITPDFEVTEQEGDLIVTLYHGDIPEVRVSRDFEERLSPYTGDLRKLPPEERETGKFVKQKIEDARNFVSLLKMRENTLMTTMLTIVDLQRAFFLSGDTQSLRPMILKDVAERTGFDISTISRVTSTKYVSTDFGTFPLRHFFSEGTVTNEGNEVSTRRVRELVKQLVDAEDKKSPLSDEAIKEQLKEQGFEIARRTIAKYREQLGIPIARLRKEF